MVKASLIAAWILCLFGFAVADQICMRTKTNGQMYAYNPVPFEPSWSKITWTPNKNKWVQDSGTNCAMRVKAYVNNYGWKYAFIDMQASSNSRNTEYGEAYVSQQRVHEHTDSCFEMKAGFGNVDLNKNIYIELVDGSCNDAAWIDEFFIPRRKAWGVRNGLGWCINGKKNLESTGSRFNLWRLIDQDPNGFMDDGTKSFQAYNDPEAHVRFNDGCARQWILMPDGNVGLGEWGSSSGTGSRSGRRALKALPMQSGRFEGLKESESNKISLLEDLYDICESYNSGLKTDLYDRETAQIIRSCFHMLEPFDKTYLEFQIKTDNAIPEAMRFASETIAEIKFVQRLIQKEQNDQNKDDIAATNP